MASAGAVAVFRRASRSFARGDCKTATHGLWYWIRKPALAVSLAVLMVMSITLFRTDAGRNSAPEGPRALMVAEPGTAVGDLQALDKNNELYSDFELLDDLQVQKDVDANP